MPETDARTSFNDERLQYWLGIGAKPSEQVAVLIKKYGPKGTHRQAQSTAREAGGAQGRCPIRRQSMCQRLKDKLPQRKPRVIRRPAEETESTTPKSRQPEEQAEAASRDGRGKSGET